jgi:hypothetical protein
LVKLISGTLLNAILDSREIAIKLSFTKIASAFVLASIVVELPSRSDYWHATGESLEEEGKLDGEMDVIGKRVLHGL